jgi:hypothetical protein
MERLDPSDHKFLNQLAPLVDGAVVYSYGMESFSRKNADGLMTLVVSHDDYKFGIIYNDFKVNGGSFGKDVCLRAVKFTEYFPQKNVIVKDLYEELGFKNGVLDIDLFKSFQTAIQIS